MSTTRSLAKLLCANCGEVTLHKAEACIHCLTPNTRSGNPPVPRPKREYGYATMKAVNYSARAEQAAAKRRARRARHQHVFQRGQA